MSGAVRATATAGSALSGCSLPRSEALLLLAEATGVSRTALLASPEAPVEAQAAARFADWVARRAAGEPIAYLVGHRDFYGRRFAVDPRVLIPRPETELLVDLALARLSDGGLASILDLGTGSGAIAITLALERSGTRVTGTDASLDALHVARANGSRLGADVAWAHGDWFEPLGGPSEAGRRFDLIAANPPYVAAGDPHLGCGDLRFEPVDALTDGSDGLGSIRLIAAVAGNFLAPGGSLLLEHGYDQAPAVRALLRAGGFAEVASMRDLAGIERVTLATRPR